MTSKGKTQFKHCVARARQRYGVKLTREKYNAAVKQIINGQSTFVESQSHARKIHIVIVDEVECKVIYDPTRKSLRSFIPMEER